MKKSKIMLAVILAFAVLIAAVCVPSFSWFPRPVMYTVEEGETTRIGGDSLEYHKNINMFNAKDVTFSTSSSQDGITYSGTTTEFDGTNMEPHARKYFRTTISNGSDYPQTVSLYIDTLSFGTINNGELCLGVNNPTRNFREYSTMSVTNSKAKTGKKRVYFQPKYADIDNTWNVTYATDLEARYGKYDVSGYTTMGYADPHPSPDHSEWSFKVYYADIYSDAEKVQFHIKNESDSKKYTQVFDYLSTYESNFSGNNCSLFYSKQNNGQNVLNGDGNLDVSHSTVADGATIMQYYPNLTLGTGTTFSAALTHGRSNDYIGNGISYSSSDDTIFTVDSDGLITVNNKAGTATLTTTVHGNTYGDDFKVETKVTVIGSSYQKSDLPIVQNIHLGPKSTIDIDWYTTNKSTRTNDNLTYEISGIYLGL